MGTTNSENRYGRNLTLRQQIMKRNGPAFQHWLSTVRHLHPTAKFRNGKNLSCTAVVNMGTKKVFFDLFTVQNDVIVARFYPGCFNPIHPGKSVWNITDPAML